MITTVCCTVNQIFRHPMPQSQRLCSSVGVVYSHAHTGEAHDKRDKRIGMINRIIHRVLASLPVWANVARSSIQEPTVGELTLDLSPPERNFSNRPEPPFELPGQPTGTFRGTAREPVRNLPEPSWELHRNLPETYRNLPGNCTRTYCGRINS